VAFWPLLAFGLLTIGLTTLVKKNELRVGEDGVQIGRGGSGRFIPYGQIVDVYARQQSQTTAARYATTHRAVMAETTPAALVIRIRVAEGVEDAVEIALSERFREDAAAAIRAAKRVHDERPESSIPAVLASPERQPESWMDDVQAAVSLDDFRNEPVTKDDLVRVAEDPRIEAEARIVAAAAAVRIAPELTERIRETASRTAALDVAQALELAAEGQVKLELLRKP
jgi:hypothetical protein